MIRLIDASTAGCFPREMDAMFRSRAETFKTRLGWEVVVENGYERDRFDDLDPLYLVSVDRETGAYRGSLRLLPTTGPNMLRDVFPQLLDGGAEVVEPTIWESSRICVAQGDGRAERTAGGANAALCELILGIGEVAVLAGLTKIVSVFDARMLRILRAAGCELTIVGQPRRIGVAMSYAALFDAGPGPLARFRQALGVSDTVLAPGAFAGIPRAGERGAFRAEPGGSPTAPAGAGDMIAALAGGRFDAPAKPRASGASPAHLRGLRPQGLGNRGPAHHATTDLPAHSRQAWPEVGFLAGRRG